MVTNIINGRIIAGDSIVEGVLVLKDGVIQGINKRKSPGAEVIDAEGRYVSPGFIDIHTHGAGGADFMDGTVEAYQTAIRMHAMHGTTLLFPTTCTSSNELLFDSFETYRKAQAYCHDGAVMGGLHLEGPYFAPEQAGAQDPAYLRCPTPEDYNAILAKGGDILKRWSFAPELDGAPAFAAALKARGILASIGHTNATFEQCEAAYLSGAEHLTHFYSCMSTITRRNAYRYAGVIEYGYWQDGMEYPTAKDDGTKLVLLAQINFGQMPHLDDFPESGILQFFIKPDDIYGCDFDNRNYDRWRPVYHENIGEPMSEEALRAMGVKTAEEVESFPLSPEFALSFEKQEKVLNMTCEDLFEREVRKIAPKLNLPVPDDNVPFYDFFSESISDEFYDECNREGHRIGGYPAFTQCDPRLPDDDKDVLLLQIDSCGEGDVGDGLIMWGDCGIGNFFISRDDLKKRDFSRVLYNWDCN